VIIRTMAWLANPDATLPVFGKPGLMFPREGMEIDVHAEEWRVLIADGTLTLSDPTATTIETLPTETNQTAKPKARAVIDKE
jgi:hypothetical protein